MSASHVLPLFELNLLISAACIVSFCLFWECLVAYQISPQSPPRGLNNNNEKYFFLNFFIRLYQHNIVKKYPIKCDRIGDRSSGDELVFAAVAITWECEHWKEMTAALCTRNSQQLSSYSLPSSQRNLWGGELPDKTK